MGMISYCARKGGCLHRAIVNGDLISYSNTAERSPWCRGWHCGIDIHMQYDLAAYDNANTTHELYELQRDTRGRRKPEIQTRFPSTYYKEWKTTGPKHQTYSLLQGGRET
jgi:hypothetical protein